MAKFKDLHLLLQEGQRILFGDDSLGTPSEYPVTTAGTEKVFAGYTTISGYNTTYPGLGVSNVAASDEFVISAPVAGERAVENYHLVRFDQLKDAVFDEASSDWQDSVFTFSTYPPGSPNDGDRYLIEPTASGVWTGLEDYIVEWSTASGTWDTYPPNEGFTTFIEDENKYYVYYDGSWAPMGEGIDHGDLIGLDGDDHIMYVPTDGSRGFSSTVSGIDPVEGYDLVTKDYLDSIIASISGTTTIISGVIYIEHSALLGLDDPNAHPATSIYTDTTNFDGILSTADDTVQKALDTIDDALTSATNIVTLSGGPQTITSDKTFDGTLTTFLNDVFFDGITITMSGTTLNTEAGAVFNYDSTATINNDATNNFTDNASITTSGTDINFGDGTTVNYEDGSTVTHESGSTEIHEDGSNDTYESGSTETHEGGSTTNYEDNSTINNSGDTNYDSTATITTSGTDIDYGDGTTVNYEDGTVETYEGGSETFHNDSSVDTYLPGAIVTFSGSDVNFEGDTDIYYGPDTTTVNEGDTSYPAGSTVTFSGTTNFDSPTNFNDNIFYNDNTISGTGDIYAGNIYADNIVNVNQKWGRIACIVGNRD